MKHTLSSIFLCCFFFLGTTSAQDYKGTVFTGGNLNVSGYFNSDDNYESERFSISVIPNVGGFVSKSFAIGGTLNYRWSQESGWSYNISDSNNSTGNTFGASLYSRYYKFFGSKFAFIATADFGYAVTIANGERISNGLPVIRSKEEVHNISAYVTPGIVYFINPSFGLEASFGRIGYQHRFSNRYFEEVGIGNDSRTSQSSSFEVDLNITSLQIGLMYYFGGKKQE